MSSRIFTSNPRWEISTKSHIGKQGAGCKNFGWFDSEDPKLFVLTRSPAWGWYLLSTIPVGFFFFCGRYLMRKLREPVDTVEITTAPIRQGNTDTRREE